MLIYFRGKSQLITKTNHSPAFSLAAIFVAPALSVALGADDVAPSDPYWSLIHDQAALDDLKLTVDQQKAWRETLNRLDLRCFPLRNRSAAEAEAGFAAAAAETRAQLAKILKPQQSQRLDQIVVRAQGPAAILCDDLATKLKLTDRQRTDIRQAISSARSMDRRGYVRAFWPGELRWQGATGDQQMLRTIEQLLAEK